MEKTFEALSSVVRRKILVLLSTKDEFNVGEISERFNISKPAISKHLDVLENAKLIVSEKRGQFIYYKLNRDNLVNDVFDFITHFCPVSRDIRSKSVDKT